MNSQLPLGRRHSGPQIGLVGSEILGLTYLDPIEQLEFVCSDLVRVLSDFDRFRSYIVGSNSDVPQFTDHYMEPAQHGVQDVLNISTEVHVFHRTRLDLDHAILEKDHAILEKDHARLDLDHARLDVDHARLDLGGEETEDRHAFSSGGPSGQSRKRPYRYPVHPSG
ncbi:hypothetical protein F2Q69_00031574 [Brassica cretica]|uniref:Uncharacterized protein n=1 Tax=Brassica cretica TaxID=69181 RepID=A0A8S9S1U2_BRACR|nr:hypothetical protein F2Q69_00031574 [Brassica cretica]